MAYLIRKATLGDVPQMIRLERKCPSAGHWSEPQYASLFANQAPTRVALIAQAGDAGEVAGFLIARYLPPEWELENVVVAEQFRRNGIGTQLMQAFLAQAQEKKGESVFLEVRESNAAARALYERLDFQQTGRRKSYYIMPLEDAVLYSKDLREGPNSA